MNRLTATVASLFMFVALLPATAQAASPRATASLPARAQSVSRAHPVHHAQKAVETSSDAAPAGISRLTTGAASLPSPSVSLPVVGGTWASIGPHGISNGGNSGRVLALLQNGSNLFLGSASGGIWRSPTSTFSHWTALTDGLPDLAIGALAVEPGNPMNMYAGTGEFAQAIDALYGVGVYYSIDGGSTWTLGTGIPTQLAVSALAVDPSNTARVYAATTQHYGNGRGIYVSLDRGHTWALTAAPRDNINGHDITDLGVGSDGTVYAAVGDSGGSTANNGIWRSIAGATAFSNTTTTIENALSWVTYRWRLSIPTQAVQASQVIWAVAGDGSNSATSGNAMGVIESSDGGTTWSNKSGVGPTGIVSQDGTFNPVQQAWYDLYIAASPTVPGTVYVGTHDIYQTVTGTLGSPVWSDITNVYGGPTQLATPANIHPDQHALIFSGTTIYAGNDGGVFSSANSGATWGPVNGDLALSQFYGGSVAATNPSEIMGGLQDNGTIVTTNGGTSWTDQTSGDGFYVAIDPTNANQMYAEYPGGNLNISTGGPAFFPNPTSGLDPSSGTDPALFATPLVLDPNAPATVYSGRAHLWKSTNKGVNWSSISVTGMTPSTVAQGCFTAAGCVRLIAVAPGDSSNLYVVDDSSNTYWTISGLGASWTNSNGNVLCPSAIDCSPKGNGSVTGVAIDSGPDPKPVYETTAGFGGKHVFKSTNDGTSWTDITGSLPNVPFRSITVDPVTHNVFAGSDNGIFESTNGGISWSVFGSGLPNAPVYQTVINAGVLYAFTHGRAAWTLSLTAAAGPATHFSVLAAGAANQGLGYSVTVTALDALNNIATGYTGMVHFTSSDVAATLPADQALSNGSGVVNVTLNTASSGATVTATDTVSASITGTSATIPILTLRQLLPAVARNAYGGYTTAIYAMNTGTAASSINFLYFDSNGVPLPPGDSFSSVPPQANRTARQDNGNGLPNLGAGVARIYSDQPVAAFVNEFAPGGTDATSYTAVSNPGGVGNTLFAATIADNAYGGYTTGIGLVNLSTSATTITITYNKGDGTPQATQVLTGVAAGAYRGVYNGDGTLPAGFAGSATISASGGALLAAVVNETGPGNQFSSYDAVPGGAATLYAPVMLRNAYGGYNTGLALVNTTATAGTVTITYSNATGPLTPIVRPIAPNGFLGLYQGSGADAPPPDAIGAFTAKIDVNGGAMIAGIVNEVAAGGTRSTSYNAFGTSAPTFNLPLVENNAADGLTTSVGVMNVGLTPAVVVVTYYDALTGSVLSNVSPTIPAGSFFAISQGTALALGTRATAVVSGGLGNVVVICNEVGAGMFMSYSGQ